jgi:hypothetical protein
MKRDERVIAREKLYYEKNKEAITIRKRAYRKNNPDKVAAWHSRYYLKHRQKILSYKKGSKSSSSWGSMIVRRYKLTPEQYHNLFEDQKGLCAACGCKEKGNRRLAVDHNHLTGAVRALLCHACNVALGLLVDSPERVEMLLRYIVKHASIPLAEVG